MTRTDLLLSALADQMRNRNITPLGLKSRNTSNDGFDYLGLALPSTATSAERWRIARINQTTDDIDYAGGSDLFDQVWDDVLTLSYS